MLIQFEKYIKTLFFLIVQGPENNSLVNSKRWRYTIQKYNHSILTVFQENQMQKHRKSYQAFRHYRR